MNGFLRVRQPSHVTISGSAVAKRGLPSKLSVAQNRRNQFSCDSTMGREGMKSLHVTALLAGCATLAAVGTARAGGFHRGTADTDLIFEEGNFNMRAGVTIVMPQRGYETLTVPTAGLGIPQVLPPGSSLTAPTANTPRHMQSLRTAIKFNVIGRSPLRRHIHAAVRRRFRVRASGDPFRQHG